MEGDVSRALSDVRAGKLESARAALAAAAPQKEQLFKRVFDEYSVDVSYKQKFKDSNAFLVYYTKGFDGPDRPSLESADPFEELQTKQFGFRNDAWINYDEARAELDYVISERADTKDLVAMLAAADAALKNYLGLAPPGDLAEARQAAGR